MPTSLQITPTSGATGAATFVKTASECYLSLSTSDTTRYGIEGVETFDLTSGYYKVVEVTVKGLSFHRAGAGVHFVSDFGLTDSSATVGARLFTRYKEGGDLDWPTVQVVSASGGNNQPVRMPWGPRASNTALIAQGDASRNLTFRIDVDEKRCSLLADDQVIYSRIRPDMVLGEVRPRLTIAKSGSTDGTREARLRGFECAYETNG